jgi:Holliday junction resolvase-like predicted endonuclease
MTNEAQTMTQTDVTLADLYRYLAEERKAREEYAKAREKAWEKQMAELNKKFSDLGITMGDVTEYTFNPDIVMQHFNELGYKLGVSARNYKIKDAKKQTIAEIDIFLQNGDSVIFVEIKTKLQEKHIDEHIERIQNVRQRDIFAGKKIIGAVAGAVIPDNVKVYALKQGLIDQMLDQVDLKGLSWEAVLGQDGL